MKWLITPFAMMVHATFSMLTVLLACELLTGNQGPGGGYELGLIFCLVAHPVMLLLLWLNWRVDGGGVAYEPHEAEGQQRSGSMGASDRSSDSEAGSSGDRSRT